MSLNECAVPSAWMRGLRGDQRLELGDGGGLSDLVRRELDVTGPVTHGTVL